MSHIHFEEEQRFTQTRWIWIVSLMLFLIPLVRIITDSKALEKNPGLILLTIGAAFLPLIIILLIVKFQLKIDAEGLHYRFVPKVNTWRVVKPADIDSFEIKEKHGLYDHVACGYKRYIFKKLIFMNITGKKYALIKLKSGNRLKIGIQNPESFQWALNRLINSNEE